MSSHAQTFVIALSSPAKHMMGYVSSSSDYAASGIAKRSHNKTRTKTNKLECLADKTRRDPPRLISVKCGQQRASTHSNT